MKFLIRRTTAVVTGVLMASPVFGDPIPQWVNSYSADGSCYCAPNLDASLSKKITPTPVGGKSIGQICERLGDGPGLLFENDEFNHPTYTDAQCGNGPAAHSSAAAEDCEGRLTDDDIICMGVGPGWDLKSAFAKKAAPAETVAATDIKEQNTQAATAVETPTASADSSTVDAEETAPPATVVESSVITPLPTDTVAGSDTESDSDSDALPAATVVAERVVPLSEPATTPNNATGQELPLATVVDSRPVTAEPAPVPAPIIVDKTDAETPLLQPRNTDVAEEATRPAVQTTLVRAPDTDSGIVLIETEPGEAVPAEVTRPVVTELVIEPKPRTEDTPVVAEVAKPEPASTDVVAENASREAQAPGVNTGLRIESMLEDQDAQFKYVQLAPVGFDFGGNGGAVEASMGQREGWGVIGRAAVVEEYSEFMLGAAYSVAPAALNGATMTLTLAGETGTFDLGITDYSDSGAMVSTMLGYDFNARLQAQGGISYSSFFDGDPSLIGLMLLHITPTMDVAARVEMGDNDNAAVGLRINF